MAPLGFAVLVGGLAVWPVPSQGRIVFAVVIVCGAAVGSMLAWRRGVANGTEVDRHCDDERK